MRGIEEDNATTKTPHGGRTLPTLVDIQRVRWRVSLLAVGKINLLCWSAIHTMQIHVLSS